MEKALKELNFQKPILSSQVPALRKEEIEQELSTLEKRIHSMEQEIISLGKIREDLKKAQEKYV